jgi:ubiquitin-protein ligase
MDVEFVVPRKLLIEDGSMSKRLYTEQQKLAENFRQFSFVRDRRGEVNVTGALRTNAGKVYEVKIELPPDYPHSIPFIIPVGWKAKCPHVYTAGNLCIMRPDQWRPIFSLAFVVAKTAIWLNKYDVYHKKGYWPGNEQQH